MGTELSSKELEKLAEIEARKKKAPQPYNQSAKRYTQQKGVENSERKNRGD